MIDRRGTSSLDAVIDTVSPDRVFDLGSELLQSKTRKHGHHVFLSFNDLVVLADCGDLCLYNYTTIAMSTVRSDSV